MDELARLLAEAEEGRGALLLIGGEAGIGKSRLVEEVAALARARSFLCLTGHCYEGDGSAPYIAFVEALDAATRLAPEATLRGAVARAGPEVTRLVPALVRLTGGKRVRGLPTDDERPYLFDAVREFLWSLAEETPVLLALEDLHWAGTPTVALLRHLAQSQDGARLLIVATFREGDAEDDAKPLTSFLENARRLRLGHTLRLHPLEHESVSTMLRGITGAEPPEPVSRAIYEHTEGNPLFVEEVVSNLLEEGRLIGPDGAWLADADTDLGVPEGVRRPIGRRLLRTGEETRQILTTAAVIGRTFRYDLLAAVAGRSVDALLDSLDEAQRARLITSGRPGQVSQLSFTHELIRQTLLTHVSAPRRQQLHLAIVKAIESGPDPEARASELAGHSVLAGDAADAEATARYLVLAAERASATTAYEEAARLYRQSLSYAANWGDTRRCDLLLSLGQAEKRLSDSEPARDAFREAAALARKLGDAEKLARAALGSARTWPTVGLVATEEVDLLREALEALPAAPTPLRSDVMTRLSLSQYYAPEREAVLALSADAVEAARECGSPVALARALQTRHVMLWEARYLEERLAISAEIVAVAEGSGMPWLAVWGHRPRIADLMEAGETAAAEAEFAAYSRLAEEVRQPIYTWQAAVRRPMLAIFHGRLIEGERLAGEQLEIGRRAGGQNLLTAYGEQMLAVRWLQGRLGEMEGLARASQAQQPELGLWRAVLAFVCAETGNLDEARELVVSLATDGYAALPHDDTRIIAVVLAAVAAAAAGCEAESRALYEELLPTCGHNIVLSEGVVCAGAADYYLALLAETMGDRAAAERHYRDAIEMNARTGARPWLALAQHAFGRMLLSRRAPGDRKLAMTHLEESLAGARQLGMGGLEGLVERLLKSHAGSVPKFPDGLTRREAEVLRLVASGLSNREISARLVLSLRTTARHVTNVYGKIGARNRADATAYAIRKGLVSP